VVLQRGLKDTERKPLGLLYLGVTHTTMSSAVQKLIQVRTQRYFRVLTLRAMHNLSGDYYKTPSTIYQQLESAVACWSAAPGAVGAARPYRLLSQNKSWPPAPLLLLS
jgi:hypothetical protein